MYSDEELLAASDGKTAGEILKEARLARGLTVEDVAKLTKIKAKHIKALEEGDEENLPGRVYAVGFVSSYARVVDLDSDQLVRLFKIRSIGRHGTLKLNIARNADVANALSWQLYTLICVLSLCGIAFYSYALQPYGQGTFAGQGFTVPAVPSDLKKALTKNMQVLENLKEEEKVRPLQETEKGVRLIARSTVWVDITTESKIHLFTGLLKTGEEFKVPHEKEGILLTTGNAAALLIRIDGKEQPALGDEGDVKRDIPLDSVALSSYLNAEELRRNGMQTVPPELIAPQDGLEMPQELLPMSLPRAE
ncbi:MAG: helix-turn-helix domain-containing protein [Pseudobdellovibrionaceae bacterium]